MDNRKVFDFLGQLWLVLEERLDRLLNVVGFKLFFKTFGLSPKAL